MEIVKNNSNLMDMDAAAAYLNIQKSTLYSLCMKKHIIFAKIGKLNRFRKLDLDKWIEARLQGVNNG
ncbi:MAG: 17 protein [Candidatus Brocadiaceae bacterium]|nr:17 protein [Candidatus Brocadiaceae bacterium]MBM2833066.1 17 protein [Candidatus Brocadiaceae bacterium]